MEKFKFEKPQNKSFKYIESLVQEGIAYGLNLQELLSKIDSVKSMIKDGIVRIVLLGSFSDGKTSAVAGLLGRLEDTMKIDADESSDELKVYRPEGLKKGFEIIDTPGLFGTKEKEIDGRSVKFSDITKKYLSEAHIIIYVCDAVTPLKDSHVPIIKWIMRDLKKLNSTIFVINKMDEAGYDLMDEEDFSNGTDIKKRNLITRLRTTINLTPTEESKLHIVCIAADPKGKGLAHWFTKADNYMKRSHIGLLRDELNKVIQDSDAISLTSSAVDASVKDVLMNVRNEIDRIDTPTNKALEKVDESCKDLQQEVALLKSELALNRKDVAQQMDNYRAALYADIKGASIETISEIIDRALGVQNNNVTFYVFQRNVDAILSSAQDVANSAISSSMIKFERSFNDHEKFMTTAIKGGAELLSKATVSKGQVFMVRDTLFKNFKFKPWGAHKMAGNLTKGLGYLGAGIGVCLEVYSWYKKNKGEKELSKLKKELTNSLDNAFANIFNTFSEESFYNNFAPSYNTMCQKLIEREEEVKVLRAKISGLEEYKSKITSFIKGDAENIQYEEV